jgi:hypothetical protein
MAESNNRVSELVNIQTEARVLFQQKNKDYGDAFATYGTVGVLVRIGDKLNRFSSVSDTGIQMVDNEGLRDTLIDLHNYSAMGIMLLDESQHKYNNQILKDIKNLILQGQSIRQIIDLGYSIDYLKQAEVDAMSLRSARVSAKTLYSFGYTTIELRTAGYNYTELVIAGCPINDFRKMGVSNSQLNTIGMIFNEIYDINIDISEMSNGFTEYETKIMDCIYEKKLSEIRRYNSDYISSKEGGNRSGYVDDSLTATQYVIEAQIIFRKEFAAYIFTNNSIITS